MKRSKPLFSPLLVASPEKDHKGVVVLSNFKPGPVGFDLQVVPDVGQDHTAPGAVGVDDLLSFTNEQRLLFRSWRKENRFFRILKYVEY